MRPPFFPKKISIAKPLKIKVFAPCHNRVFGEEECDRLVDLWERYMPSSAPNARVLRFEDFELDVRAGELRKHGVRLRLQGQPLQVLAALLNGSGDVLTREELQRQIWAADTFVDFGHSLHNAIARLREVLGDSAETPRYIETLPRRGYRFIAPVETLEVVSPSRAAHPEDPRPTSAESKHPPSRAMVAGARKLVDLPTPRTSLIGREREVAQASEFLLQPDVRLLSLTGAGGTGKTRLAIAVASATAHHFTAGVQFVGLASISHADLVGTAVAKSLDIQQVSRRTVPQLLGDYLQDAGSFLLVLDNFEQVLPAATVVAEMLTACPNVKVMVTSRAGLRIYGEQEFPVAPLEQNSAVQLFAQRAAAVRPNFAITGENSAVIREICSKLDGLPLAIELAAARTKLLSPNAILERLQSRLQLLTGGALDLPERQQTLRNTIDWSHGLLNEAEQKLFRRFSAFVGGATLEATEAVCNTHRFV